MISVLKYVLEPFEYTKSAVVLLLRVSHRSSSLSKTRMQYVGLMYHMHSHEEITCRLNATREREGCLFGFNEIDDSQLV